MYNYNDQKICMHCYMRIKKNGCFCLSIVNQIFESNRRNETAFYHSYADSEINTIVRFLELKKMLVTTDFGDAFIAVRLNTRNYNADKRTYCWCEN